MLTAIGADHVRRQGQICDRAIARCAGKVDQFMQPLAVKSRPSRFASDANCGGGNVDHHAQARTLVAKFCASTPRSPFYDATSLSNQSRAGKNYRQETINFQKDLKTTNAALE